VPRAIVPQYVVRIHLSIRLFSKTALRDRDSLWSYLFDITSFLLKMHKKLCIEASFMEIQAPCCLSLSERERIFRWTSGHRKIIVRLPGRGFPLSFSVFHQSNPLSPWRLPVLISHLNHSFITGSTDTERHPNGDPSKAFNSLLSKGRGDLRCV